MPAAPAFVTDPPRVRLTGPADLAVCLPYLLGFVPRASLVAVSLDEARELALLARVDLPADGPVRRWERAADEFGTRIGSAAARAGAVTTVVVVYPPEPAAETEPDDGPVGWGFWRDLSGWIADALQTCGIQMLDAVLVSEGRWWSLWCVDPDCCPYDGTPLPPAGTSVAEVGMVAAGLTVRPDRASVGAGLQPAAEADRSAFAALVDAVQVQALEAIELVEAALGRCLAGPVDPEPAVEAPTELPGVLAAVGHVLVRDAVSHCATRAESEAAIRLWSAVTALAPDRLVAEPACLLATAAYQDGNGLLAQLALERALGAQPEHVLATDLARALQSGVPPEEIRSVCAAGAAEARARLEASG